MIRVGVQYVLPSGGLTKAGWDVLSPLDRVLVRLDAIEAKLAAAVAVAGAAGGATVDAEARAELAAIKAALT